MKRTFPILVALAAFHLVLCSHASAQDYGIRGGIRGVTRRVPMDPRPPGFQPLAPDQKGGPQQNQNGNQRQQPAPPALVPAAVRPSAPATVYATRPADPEKLRAADQKAVEFEKKRAEEDFGWAQYALGVRYLMGNGVDKDLEQARKWLAKAAKNGESQAVKKLAELAEVDGSNAKEEKSEVLPKSETAVESPKTEKSQPSKGAEKK